MLPDEICMSSYSTWAESVPAPSSVGTEAAGPVSGASAEREEADGASVS